MKKIFERKYQEADIREQKGDSKEQSVDSRERHQLMPNSDSR
jgi:hypothetical protein